MLAASFGLRFVTYLLASFFPIFLPEVWRQLDTLGVSYRYFLKFTVETDSSIWFRMLPSVLQSGDTAGIMPMEFPILNLVFAPFWGFGTEAGRAAIYFVLAILVYGLSYFLFRISRGIYRWGFLLFPTVSYATDYFAKFMPDTLSYLLVLTGVILPFSRLSKSRLARYSSFFVAVGILMKPTAMATLGFYFIIRKIDRPSIVQFFKRFTIPVMLGAIYYTFGLKYLQSFDEGHSIFSTQIRSPFTCLKEVLLSSNGMYLHWTNRPFFYGALPLMLIAFFYRARRLSKAVLILILQFLLIAAMDGEHSFTHDYYYVSLAPTCCFLMVYSLFVLRRKWIGVLILIAIMVRPIELSTKDFVRMYKGSQSTMAKECSLLKERNRDFPWHKGIAFRSTNEPFPSLGLCFGEKQGSKKSEYGFFYRSENGIDPQCKAVDRTEHLILARCP